MTHDLRNRTALVTGGGTGIGAAIARALAATGARVAITYRTHAPDPALMAELRGADGAEALAVALDATDEDEVRRLATRLKDELGGIDVLVNNVGGLLQRCAVADMPFDLWRRVMAVNLDSTFLATHHLLPIISRGHGRIINVSSLAGRSGGHPGATAYATSKAALFGFGRGLARELAPEGITVNTLAPGFIEATPFHDTFTTAESKQATIGTIPTGRAGVPFDVATAAVWLAGTDTDFITGTVIDINGGQYFG